MNYLKRQEIDINLSSKQMNQLMHAVRYLFHEDIQIYCKEHGLQIMLLQEEMTWDLDTGNWLSQLKGVITSILQAMMSANISQKL